MACALGMAFTVMTASTAGADDALVLEEGAQLERAHATENAIAAGVTAGILGYESVQLFRMAAAIKPGGYTAGLEAVGQTFEYSLGALTGIGSVSMVILGVHDLTSTPVADAHEAYRAGDHTAAWRLADRGLTKKQRIRRTVAWMTLVLDGGLAAYGATRLASNDERAHDLGVVNLWVGGTGALVSATALLHLRQPVAEHTYRRLGVSATPGGVLVGGTF